LALSWFLRCLSDEGIMDNIIFYTALRFDWDIMHIAFLAAIAGASYIIGQGLLLKPLVSLMNAKNALLVSTAFSLSTLCIAFVPYGWLIYPLFLLRSIVLIGTPIIQAEVSCLYSDAQQGEVAGVLSSLRIATQSIGPLIFANVYTYFISDSAPIQIVGIVYYLSTAVAFVNLVYLFIFFIILKNPLPSMTLDRTEAAKHEEELQSLSLDNEEEQKTEQVENM